MAESIRAVFNVNAKALKLLLTSGSSFSLRQWIEEDDKANYESRQGIAQPKLTSFCYCHFAISG